jgi:hypothetical protein
MLSGSLSNMAGFTGFACFNRPAFLSQSSQGCSQGFAHRGKTNIKSGHYSWYCIGTEDFCFESTFFELGFPAAFLST